MEKRNADSAAHRSRTGSHGTKGRATGAQLMPTPRFDDYDDFVDRYIDAARAVADCKDRLHALKLRLEETLPYSEYERTKEHRDALASQIGPLQNRAKMIRDQLKQSRRGGEARIFLEVAREMLSEDVFAGLIARMQREWSKLHERSKALLAAENTISRVQAEAAAHNETKPGNDRRKFNAQRQQRRQRFLRDRA